MPQRYWQRLWIYQRERFPLVGHGLLIASFSFSAVSFSAVLRGAHQFPGWTSYLVAFLTSLFIFLQLRVADEFKDLEEDSRWRPYRPVPRGLISLKELAVVALLGGLVQLSLAGTISWRLGAWLLVVWGYLGLMTKEFFVRDWIVARPVTYLWTHMLVVPMADFYATACDWSRFSAQPPAGLFWFLAVSFCNGAALEIGRKVRAPEDEEQGVKTYTVLWGRGSATAAWLMTLGAGGIAAAAAAARVRFMAPMLLVLGVLLVTAVVLAWRFAAHPTTARARSIEHFSGAWTLAMYTCLGVFPIIRQMAGGGL